MIYHGASVGGFTDLDAEVTTAIRVIEDRFGVKKASKLVLAVTGVSGMSLGFPLARALGCDIVVLRKPDEDCHGAPGKLVGVSTKGRDVLFVDDFVSCGRTRRRVRDAIKADGGRMKLQYTAREERIASAI